jgi:phosphoribosyl 1,2-cyclic phosphate phosphodiesterase
MAVNLKGHVLAYLETGSSRTINNSEAAEMVKGTVRGLIVEAGCEPSDVVELVAGFADVTWEGDTKPTENYTNLPELKCNQIHLNDVDIALAGITLGKPGIVVSGGTNFTGMAITEKGKRIHEGAAFGGVHPRFMTLKLTILGCGTSGGVPRVGNIWGACDPANPKNRRRRCSVLVQKEGGEGTTNVLVDTPPDLREQLLDVGVGWLDGVLYTHDHADHTHGIDDLRMVSYNGRRRVAAYYDELTGQQLRQRFAYCFKMSANGEYPPILDGHQIAPGLSVKIPGPGGGIEALPFRQRHGSGETLGFRFGGIAYSPDISDLPEESLKYLENLDVWIIDALRYVRHPSHFSVEEALTWIRRIKPKRAVLTHMHVDLDYEALAKELPEGVEPGYDGMVLTTKDKIADS